MTKDELRETLHREMLFYYFAQRDIMLEIRKNESLMSAVWRKMQPYAAGGFPRTVQRGQQHRGENRDDRDHDEQLN